MGSLIALGKWGTRGVQNGWGLVLTLFQLSVRIRTENWTKSGQRDGGRLIMK